MSLLDKLAEKGLDEAEKRSDEWIGKLVEAGRAQAESKLDAGTANMAGKGLDWIEANRDKVKQLGMNRLQAVVGFVAGGEEKRAELVWLSTEAGWADLDAASDAAAEKVKQAAEDRASLIGLTAQVARVLFPLIVGAAL